MCLGVIYTLMVAVSGIRAMYFPPRQIPDPEFHTLRPRGFFVILKHEPWIKKEPSFIMHEGPGAPFRDLFLRYKKRWSYENYKLLLNENDTVVFNVTIEYGYCLLRGTYRTKISATPALSNNSEASEKHYDEEEFSGELYM